MIAEPVHSESPFPHFCCVDALPSANYAALHALFKLEGNWQARDASFYACALRDVTDDVGRDLLGALAARMRFVLDMPLTDHVQLTAQRMLPGQRVGAHSDQPSLGYEIARLIVQFNDQWKPAHGGVLQLFKDPEGAATLEIEPRGNVGFGFVLHPASHHAVTEVTQPRHSLVFNFWHPANTAELAEAVRALFAGVSFGDLPGALDPIASQAEAGLPEETTLRAGYAASALQRWGYADEVILAGYRSSAGLEEREPLEGESLVASELANWVAGLYDGVFDLEGWHSLRERCRAAAGNAVPWPRLQSIAALCLPVTD